MQVKNFIFYIFIVFIVFSLESIIMIVSQFFTNIIEFNRIPVIFTANTHM